MRKIPARIFIAILCFVWSYKNSYAQCIEQANSIFSVGIGFPNPTKTSFRVAFANNEEFKVSGNGPGHLKYEYMLSKRFSIGLTINVLSASVTYKAYQSKLDPIAVNGVAIVF